MRSLLVNLTMNESKKLVGKNLAKYIDHTLLNPETAVDDLIKLISEARQYGFYAVCVAPIWVDFVKKKLSNTDVKICTVVGFPQGTNTTTVKVYEAQDALRRGADELDMVINIFALKSKHHKKVVDDIQAVVKVASGLVEVEVIIETALLNEEEKEKACELAKQAGANFVKTSTGFLSGGVDVRDVALIRKIVGSKMGITASGVIRTKEAVQELFKAGATRISTSEGVKIITKDLFPN